MASLMDILSKRANPTMLDEDDPRIRDRRDRERKGNQILSLGDVLFTGQNRNPIHHAMDRARKSAPVTNTLTQGNPQSVLERAQAYHGGSFADAQQKALDAELLKQKEQKLVGIGTGITRTRVGSPTLKPSPDAGMMYPESFGVAMPDKGDNVASRQGLLMQSGGNNFSSESLPVNKNAYPEVEGGGFPPLGAMDDNSPLRDNNSTLREATPEKPVNKEELGETPADTPSLWKTWGSLADDPKKRRDAYLGSIKNIYMKKMMLDSIANLTGGQSQGGSWAEMAIAELDAVEKFDSEQRLHNQWKALFFREDGTYDPPKNRKEAMERGGQLGYDADQMKDIMSVFPKETDDRTGIERNISYILSLKDGSMKRSLMKRYGMIETDDLTTAEKAADRAVRDGVITEEERDAYIRSIYVPTDASKVTTAMSNFEWYQNAEEKDKQLIAKLIGIDKVDKVASFSPSDIAGLMKSSEAMDNFSDDERSKIYDIARMLIPGFNPPADGGSKTSAPQGAIEKLMSNPTPEMRKAFREKYGHLPEGL